MLALALTLAVRFCELDRPQPTGTAKDGSKQPTFHPEFVPGAALQTSSMKC